MMETRPWKDYRNRTKSFNQTIPLHWRPAFHWTGNLWTDSPLLGGWGPKLALCLHHLGRWNSQGGTGIPREGPEVRGGTLGERGRDRVSGRGESLSGPAWWPFLHDCPSLPGGGLFSQSPGQPQARRQKTGPSPMPPPVPPRDNEGPSWHGRRIHEHKTAVGT